MRAASLSQTSKPAVQREHPRRVLESSLNGSRRRRHGRLVRGCFDVGRADGWDLLVGRGLNTKCARSDRASSIARVVQREAVLLLLVVFLVLVAVVEIVLAAGTTGLLVAEATGANSLGERE
jgi:hypothetical protein